MNQDIIEEAEKEFIKLINGKALPTKQLTEVAEHYFIVGYEIASEKLTSSQTEISDEEIDNVVVKEYENVGDEKLFPNFTDKDIWGNGFYEGAKWYREQLKQKI